MVKMAQPISILYGITQKVLSDVIDLSKHTLMSWWKARNELEKLKDSIRMIQLRLIDAEKRYSENANDYAVREWLRRLRIIIHEADDLFDEVHSRDGQLELLHYPQVSFLSKASPLRTSVRVARKIKHVRERLDSIKLDMQILNLQIGECRMPSMPFMGRSDSEFPLRVNMIGREKEKSMIMETILGTSNKLEQRILAISIVGFGGIGKTTLAQSIYNDPAIQKNFQVKGWVCAPHFEDILGKVFHAFTGEDHTGLPPGKILSGILTAITAKKFILVLDDLWNENRSSWQEFTTLLECASAGSTILVTTRSPDVGHIVADPQPSHVLQLLSDDDAWALLCQVAFARKTDTHKFLDIGKELVRKCGNVPLAIHALGSLLYNKHQVSEWESLREIRFSDRERMQAFDFMPVLKLTYLQLPIPQLKQCFTYCSMFPKDYVFIAQEMVFLWMAQGFIKTFHDTDTPGDVANNYIEELLRRGFFQDPVRGDDQKVLSFKVHDLIHELAIHVAGYESWLVEAQKGPERPVTNELLHLNLEFGDATSSWEALSSLLKNKQLRSLLLSQWHCTPTRCTKTIGKLISRFTCLRVLSLRGSSIGEIPDRVGNLIHLRYLDLSFCEGIIFLPNSISKLWNLQTLLLNGCKNLSWLPRGLTKLVNLQNFNCSQCPSLCEMPRRFGKLKALRMLNIFFAGYVNGVDVLAGKNLQGPLSIRFSSWRYHSISEAMKANLKGKKGLTELYLYFLFNDIVPSPEDATLFLELLQPPTSVRKLGIINHKGERLPVWMGDTLPYLLPELSEVEIARGMWRELPAFYQLQRIKVLKLIKLNLEFIQSWESASSETLCFPSLEQLVLKYLPRMKGWWRELADDQNFCLYFPRLTSIELWECPNLVSFPMAPMFITLSAEGIQAKLLRQLVIAGENNAKASSSCFNYHCRHRRASIYGFDGMESITTYLSSMESLEINGFDKDRVKDMAYDTGRIDCDSLPILQELKICGFPELATLPQFITDFSFITKLAVEDCPQLTTLPLFTHLTHLHLSNCPQLVSLPASYANLIEFTHTGCPQIDAKLIVYTDSEGPQFDASTSSAA